MKTLLNLRRYPLVLLFALAGLFAVAVALLSVDLVRLTVANFDYLGRTGLMGIREGGFLQLIELAAKGALALAGYFGFKLCEAEATRRYHVWQDRPDK
jgi:hypothetical protein